MNCAVKHFPKNIWDVDENGNNCGNGRPFAFAEMDRAFSCFGPLVHLYLLFSRW